MSNVPPPPPPAGQSPFPPPMPPQQRSFKDKAIAWAKAHPIWTAVIALVVLALLASPFTAEPASDSTAKDSSSETKKSTDEEPADDPTKKSKKAEKKPDKKKPARPIDKLEDAVKDTDADIEDVELTGRLATVEFKVQDNFTDGTIRTGIAQDVFAIAEAASESGVQLRELSFRGVFPLIDKYGKDEDGQVFFTTFAGADLEKINYD